MKRFTETTKWSDPWFMDLPVKYKAFWFYICDQCDCAGIWEPNIRLAIAQIGEPLELVEILRVFAGRIEQLKDGKLWVKKFIQFQYGILSPECKPHLSVLKRLDELGLYKGYPKGIHTLMDKEKEKEKEKVQEKESRKSKATDQIEVVQYCLSRGLTQSDGEWLWQKWTANGWKNGRSAIRDWRATVIQWQIQGDIFPSQKNKGFGQKQTMTKYDLPLPRGCTIRSWDGAVLDSGGRVMDINQVRKAQ